MAKSKLAEMTKSQLIGALFDSIEFEPEAERPLLRKIALALRDIDRKLASISRDVRDCNVIAARTLGRLGQFKIECERANG